jgi:hypothetical protein
MNIPPSGSDSLNDDSKNEVLFSNKLRVSAKKKADISSFVAIEGEGIQTSFGQRSENLY